MTKLLLPYAHDREGNLTYIDYARKDQEYTCPTCKKKVLLRISKISKGQKYYKRNHFAHKVSSVSSNHCSETFLHKTFKTKCAEFICEKLACKNTLTYEWQCSKCHNKQHINLLNDITNIDTEHHIDNNRVNPKPDISLLDNNGRVTLVIEIVVTHKPEAKVLQYYKENNIKCLQITISDFDDCEHIEKLFTQSSRTEFLPNLVCDECNKGINIVHNDTYLETDKDSNDRIINFLKRNGNQICSKCGGRLQIKKMWHGAPYLRCENYPRCDYYECLNNYDQLIFPNMQRNCNK